MAPGKSNQFIDGQRVVWERPHGATGDSFLQTEDGRCWQTYSQTGATHNVDAGGVTGQTIRPIRTV
jgi:hypothetical protein